MQGEKKEVIQMKQLTYLMVVFLIGSILQQARPTYGQSTAKQKIPQVPITYRGDTEGTIMRRAKWIEGAKREGKLIYWSSLGEDLAAALIAKFNKVYPFIAVEYWKANTEKIEPRVEAEFGAGSVSSDVIVWRESREDEWRKMGIVEKWTQFIPDLKRIDKRMYRDDWAQAGHTPIAPQYNTKLVSAAEAPKKWEDLLNPKWKGKIGMTAWWQTWETLAFEKGGWGMEKTLDFLGKLSKQQIIWGTSNTGVHSLLKAGEFSVNAGGLVYHVLNSQKEGAPVEFSRVSPMPSPGPRWAMQKKAPHPNAALLFLEWVFSPQGLVIYEETTGMGAAFPGSGTKTAKLMEGVELIPQLSPIPAGTSKKFMQVMGIQ